MNILKKLFKFGGNSDFGILINSIISIIGAFIIILLWHVISINELISTNILPDPFNVISCIPSLITDNYLFANIWYTVKLNLSCYVYAILISFPIGFIIALFPITNILFGKYISAIRFIPLPSITGIFLAIFGLTFGMKIWFLTVAIMIYIIPAVVNKINDIQNPANEKDNVYLQTAQTLGMTSWQKFRYVYFPYVTSNVAETCIDLLAISYSYVVIAEMIYKDGLVSGMGALINTMVRQSQMPQVYALIFLIIIIGCLQDFLFKKIVKLIFPYKYKTN